MKVKSYLFNLFNQFIPVVLGVYVGIVASNWNANSIKKAEQNEFVMNLALEIQANMSKLEETLAYQETIILSAGKVRQELDQKTMEAAFWTVGHFNMTPGWEGLKIPTLESSVHQAGIMTNALSGLDFKVINTIARSYNYQEEYKVYAQKLIFDNLTQLDGQVKTAEVLNELEVWHDVRNFGQELLRQYDQTLKELRDLKNE
jgi:hypothetical protein